MAQSKRSNGNCEVGHDNRIGLSLVSTDVKLSLACSAIGNDWISES